MTGYLDIIVPLAITGAGVVTGPLFAFSNFVMSSLAELPNDKAQSVKRRGEDLVGRLHDRTQPEGSTLRSRSQGAGSYA